MSQPHEESAEAEAEAEAEAVGEGNTRHANPSQPKENSEKEKKEEHRSGANHLSIVVPEQLSHESLGTADIDLPLVRETKWEDLKKTVKAWLRNPKNLALLLWGTAVGISGAMLFLIMVGFLDRTLRPKSKRDTWFEINNQILNALFTLMCLYLHPVRILHLYFLYRWQPDDIKQLRKIYCKNGTYKPHEWSNMLIVVGLLNLNCFGQYALCGLNWGYKRSNRPTVGVGLCLAVAIGAPTIAGIYTSVSSLGKNYEEDEEHDRIESKGKKVLEQKPSIKISQIANLTKKFTFADRDGSLVENPEWIGGIFEVEKDRKVALLTTFCGFCVFGYNMERLGFGNRFVHIATFILLCTAPYWIFFLAATNVDNDYVRHGMSYGGILLCVFGLLYGGFWRIQMRKAFGLPPQTWCFGKASLTDCTQWLFCSLCSLCQEVRTSEAYKIRDSKFYERKKVSHVTPEGSLRPVCEENGMNNIQGNGLKVCINEIVHHDYSEKVVEDHVTPEGSLRPVCEENGMNNIQGNGLKVCINEIVHHDYSEKVVEDHVELHAPKPFEIRVDTHPSDPQKSYVEGTIVDSSALVEPKICV